MSKTNRRIVGEIRKLDRERVQILKRLLGSGPLLKGSLSLVMRRCGKPNCHCVREPAHPVWVLITRPKAKPRCQVVRLADVETVRGHVKAYKEFRIARRRLCEVEKAQRLLLLRKMEERHMPYE